MKYGNRKTTVDGVTFDSLAESRRYQELQIMQRAGLISRLTCQPAFELAPAFTHNGKRERAITYVADFQYAEIASMLVVVEDVKSPATRTALYKLKRKLFLAKYGKLYEFREVES